MELTDLDFSPNILSGSTVGLLASDQAFGLNRPVGESNQLVVVDAGIGEYTELVEGLGASAAVLILDPTVDGISQIDSAISQFQSLDAVHIVSHGNAGQLQLGSTQLNSETLAVYKDVLEGWDDVLTDTADILIYGCNVAEGERGQSFVQQLSSTTGADIAASVDLTGSAALEGDWDLEVKVGSIETDLAFDNTVITNFDGVLMNDYVVQTDPNFQNEVIVTGLTSPTAAEFLPDGRVLVSEKNGTIKIIDPNVTVPSTSDYLVLPDVTTSGEKGLIDIALDPDFETNNYIYAFYTLGSDTTFQISRFIHQGNTADLSSEFVVWKDPNAASSPDHFGGGLNFGPDGKLYLTTGDKGQNTPQLAQDLTRIEGSILRINKDGTIPEDNPYFGNTQGYAEEIWASGLRNPFRSDWDLQTGDLYIGDVGFNDIEEVNRINFFDAQTTIQNGGDLNFGWPFHEGTSGGDPNFIDAIYEYPHTNDRFGSGAVISGSVYRGSMFPTEFQGAYFFGDFTQDYIKYLKFDGNGDVIDADPSTAIIDPFNFEQKTSNVNPEIKDLVFIDEGVDGALYYLNFTGELRRITYFDASGGNQPPQIDEQATGATSLGGLAYQFTGVANDSDGDTLTYLWDFGDGNQATGATVTHTYTSNGTYEPTLVVSDGQASTPDDSYKLSDINIGTPPTAAITIRTADGTALIPTTDTDPLTGEPRLVIQDLFRAGDTVFFEGLGNDLDGILGESNYDWKVQFLHDDHTHPTIDSLIASSGSFEITTTEHGFSADLQVGFTIDLTVTDADGLQITERVVIFPEKVDLSFNDNLPGDFEYIIDSIGRTSTDTDPFVLDTAINFEHTITAPETRDVNGFTYIFDSWSTGETNRVLNLAAPETAQTYIANYVEPNPDPEPPVAQNDGPITVAIDSANNVLNVLQNDSDPDPGDTLTVVGLSLTDTTSTDTSISTGNGSAVDISAAGDNLLYTPAAGFVGTEVVYYTISDSTGRTATASVTIGIDDGQLPVTSGLVLHLDADKNVTTDGSDLVTGWLDQSSSGNDLIGSGDPRLATGVVNGHNAIRFDGDGDKLERTLDVNLPSGNSDRTIFLVAKYDSTGNGGLTYGQTSRGRAFGLVVNESGNLGVQAWGSANDEFTSEAGTGQGWLVQSIKLESGSLTQYKDGNLIDTATVDYDTSLAQLLIGSELDGSPFLDMDVASVVTYDRALSEAERLQVENFLQNRYLGSGSPVNNAPDAVEDSFSVDAGSTNNILTVLANDSDPDGDPLTIVEASTNGSGAVTIAGNALSYTPNVGFTGTETVTYVVSDGRGGTDTAQATINVALNTNQPPDAVNDSFTVDEDSSNSVLQVLSNDSDPDSASGLIDLNDYLIELAPTYSKPLKVIDDVAGGALDGVSFVFDSTDVGGEAHFHQPQAPDYLTQHNVASNGPQINFTFARQDGQAFSFESFDYTSDLQFDLNGSANAGFTVIGSVAGGGTVSQTFGAASAIDTLQTATLNGIGWDNVTSVRFLGDRIENDLTAQLTQELNIDNVVVGAALSITSVGTPDQGGTVSISGGTLVYTPASDFNGQETFTYTVQDALGATDTATVTVTVAPVNDTPLAVGDSYSVAQNSTDNALNVLVNDFDPDGDPLTIIDLTQPDNGGTVVVSQDGNSLIYTPAPGFTGTETFNYNVEDPSGASNPFIPGFPVGPAAVSITVTEPSNLPITSGLVLQLDADSGVTTNGSQVASWADQSGAGNDLTALGDPNLIIGALNGHNVIDLDGNGDALQRLTDISGLPEGNSDRTVFFVANYRSVGNGGFSYGRDRRGEAFGVVVDENGNLGVQGWSNASDQITSESGTNQGWLLQTAKLEAGTLTQYKDGTLIDTSTADYNTTLDQILLGSEIDGSPYVDMSVASVLVFDRALTATEQQQIEAYLQSKYFGTTPGGGNTDPVATADTAVTPQDTAVNIDVLANDNDTDGDPLTLSISTQANSGTASVNDNGTPGDVSDDFISYTPNPGFSGNDSFAYQVSDGNGGTDTATVNVSVSATGGGNTDPVATADTAVTPQDTAVNIDVLANDNDTDGDPLTLSISTQANSGTASVNDNGTPGDVSDDFISYTPNPGFSGNDSFA
ncbi:MAG: Ig-like domain-containing protein, partial [Cyanobacteria bacterium P01_D01_bin.156]